ncbi:MAG: ribbon-helix-helix protein, CopG family [Alphaproteobacteria bacterium]|nr:ribbon-helix-helix protein, CopG family [Alphaproteobacteria bacterium]
MRTIIELGEREIAELAALTQREGISRAEAVRRAVREYLTRHGVSDPDAAFGLWRGRSEDGLAYQDRLRGEWSE